MAALATAGTSLSAPAGLYQSADPRPGPDILYAPPVTAPQLTNAPGSVWTAAPILVSGTTAYRQGEFLYQDWIYDDRGAGGNAALRDTGPVRNGDPSGGGNGGEVLINPSFGTYTYPQNHAVYAENAADLVELRARPLADSTAFRVTLNTMTPVSVTNDAVAFTIALAHCTVTPCPTHAFPHGAQSLAPADVFLTVHGTTGELVDSSLAVINNAPVTVAVDQARRQVEVRVPHADWDPGTNTIRMTAGVGLWDHAAGKYLVPQSNNSDATHPGGLGGLSSLAVSAFFNVAFRDTRAGHGNSEVFHPVNTFADPVHGVLAEPTYWRDYTQGLALRTGDLSSLYADVNFNTLESGTTNNASIPTSGAMDRIFSSHFQFDSHDGAGLGQGVDFAQGCSATSPNPCPPEYKGQLQPYAIYIPAVMPAAGYGMTMLPHSLSASYNQYYGSHNQSQFGDRGSLVITTEDHGPDGWYYGAGAADPFEAWADAAQYYPLDPGFTAIGGYSMGGYATYKFSTLFPDLFSRIQPTVGPPAVGIWIPPLPPTGGDQTNTNRQLASLRNIPALLWNSTGDELVPYAGAVTQASTFGSLGYRYEFDSFSPADHFLLTFNDQFAPGAAFLGNNKVDRNPAHVTYVVNPKMQEPAYGFVGDHAYWLSAIKVRDASGAAPLGTIDVRSQGFGQGDPTPSGVVPGAGALTGGQLPAVGFASLSQTWGPAPATAVADVLDVKGQNVSDVTVNVERARVDCNVKVNVTSDVPLTVHLPVCGRDVVFVPAGANPSNLPNTATGQPLPPELFGAALVVGGALLGGPALVARRRRRQSARRLTPGEP
jgi:hypothetical protein